MGFDEFFESEHDGLIRLCWLTTLDREAAADVAQETMARAWRNWDELTGPGTNPRAWVRTVALNLARSRWRRLTRTTSLVRLLNDRERTSDRRPSVSDPGLLTAIGGLTIRQREAILLRYWADLKLDECAEVMEISVGSVNQHLARAHRHLRGLIDPTTIEEIRL